jgi:hypothetical protein
VHEAFASTELLVVSRAILDNVIGGYGRDPSPIASPNSQANRALYLAHSIVKLHGNRSLECGLHEVPF